MALPYHQYSSAQPFFGAAPAGLSVFDQHRTRAYALYEQMYWNHPETFKLLQRGEDSQPIYLPSARKIIEATNRFLAVDWDFVINPSIGTPDAQTQLQAFVGSLFKRENMYVKFAQQRRYGLIWGDAIWHITADPTKAPGRRISIHDVHPARYFPIEDGPRLVGVHLVDITVHPRDPTKQVHRRQTYRREDNGTISTELTLWELGTWDDRYLDPKDMKLVANLAKGVLPPAIQAIPVYHIPNQSTPGSRFGSSEIRGIETVLAAANQAVTDQDLALAMAGLGVYWTDAAPPADEEGEPTDWEIGPARVTEVPMGRQFGRAQGVGSIEPSLQHIEFVLSQAQTGVGVPDIAAGKVDVAVAESGISLRLQLAPILAKNAEKEQAMLGIYDQMFFDLATQWLPGYEAFSAGMECEMASVVGDPLPVNRAEVIAEVTALLTAGLVTIEQAQAKLAELGWDFSISSPEQLMAQTKALVEARSFDPFTNRFNAEIEAASGQVIT